MDNNKQTTPEAVLSLPEMDPPGGGSSDNRKGMRSENELTVVGIGASAGGVEALEVLFSALPADSGMAFVVVQHLARDFDSCMQQIVARRSSMTIEKIENGVALKPDHVYVLPSGLQARVELGKLVVEAPKGLRQQNPIDLMFESLASNYRADACAVILSGTGSDGAAGVQKIHQAEGLVIVQNEASSKFVGMPRAAIGSGVVDAILPIEEISDAILRFNDYSSSQHPQTRQSVFSVSMDAETRIQQLLHRKHGIDFEYYKKGLFARRVANRISLSGASGVESYLQELESDPAELSRLYNNLLIGVTEFFRDADAFAELQHRVLPSIVQAAENSQELRIWITPCATGEEAYSIAMLLDELFEQRQICVKVKIFATDVNSSCIEFASRGRYPAERLANVSKERLSRYFRFDEGEYLVNPRIRKQIVFARHDLLQDAPFTNLDLVSCRNLLIYFNEHAKKKVLSLFNFSLKSSGALFLGASESISQLPSAFRAISEVHRIYQKHQDVKYSQFDLAIGNSSNVVSREVFSKTDGDVGHKELLSAYDSLLSAYIPPGLLIDDQEQVLHIFGDFCGSLLRQGEGRPKEKLLDLLPDSLRSTATDALKRARIDNRPVVMPDLEIEYGGQQQMFKLIVMPVHNRYSPKYLLTLEKCQPDRPTENSHGQEKIHDDMVQDTICNLKQELAQTRDSLHDSILNLKAANEEMQSTNEELIAANEELQSTNEELHSVNEELFTVNSEYQRKITELTELTDDMDNLLDSIQVDTIYLDRLLRIRKFTLGIANTFKLLPQDIGRDFGSFNHNLRYENLIADIQSVLDSKSARDKEVADRNGNWYLMRLLPYWSRGSVEGVLLTLIDITEIKTAERRLLELSEIVQASDDAIFRISGSGEIRTWNRGAQVLFLHDEENIIGRKVQLLGADEANSELLTTALHQVRERDQFQHFELQAVRRNGDVFDAQFTISPIFGTGGELEGASVVLRDISAQKKAESQIRDEVQRRDRFLAVLSHELRNPTAAIANAISVIKKSGIGNNESGDMRIHKAIEIAHQQTGQLGKMMEDLLSVSRVTNDRFRLRLRPVDICQTARQVVQSLDYRIRAKNQVLSLEIPERPLWAMVDETRMIQAQANLLINACKYTPENGQIKYSVWLEDESVRIELQDDGEGMKQDLVDRVFQVFVQGEQPLDRSAGGMGLGLPLVKIIIEAHGGSVSAESPGLGLGSTFGISIPTGDFEPASVEVNCHQDSGKRLEDLRFLLVEDNEGAREMLGEYFRLEGLDVTTAENGLEALQLYDEVKPAICIVDIGLPDLNGYEVARRIRTSQWQPELLIAVTGYGQESDRRRVQAAGFDVHLVKPVEPEKLIETIAHRLDARTGVGV